MKLPLIAELRKQKQLTQQDVADAINATKRTYAAWERGENDLPLDMLVRLANFYGVTTDYILGREPVTAEKKEKLPEHPTEDRERMEFVINKDMLGDIKPLEEYIRAIVRNEMDK